jgi:hypothetical protein
LFIKKYVLGYIDYKFVPPPGKIYKRRLASLAMTSKESSSKKSSTVTFKIPSKDSFWKISAVVLAVLLVIVLINGNGGSGVGMTVSSEEAGQRVLEFANGQGAEAELLSVNDDGALYEVILSISNQEVPVYVTKDGESLIPSLIPLTSEGSAPSGDSVDAAPTNLPKSDKPVVELFIMSHCPYGTQIEKGILPVVEVLKDSIDFELKFVYYAMHPSAGEVEEQLNQYCIQKNENEKFLDYLTCFLEAGDGAGCIDSTSIDKSLLASCFAETDKTFNIIENLEDQSSWLSSKFPKFDIHKAENEKYGVGGSPTLVINGQTASSGRDSVSLLNTICSSFNNAPEACNTEFEAVSPTPGFGFGTQEISNNVAAGCGV